MKILFVSSLYPSEERPQYCIFIEQQAQALQQLGHKVDVLCLKAGNQTTNNIDEPYVRNGLCVYTWHYNTNKVAERIISPLGNKMIRAFLVERNYDAISLHMGSLRAFEAIVGASKRLKTVIIQHYHGLNVWKDCHENLKQKLLGSYHRMRKYLFLKRVDAVVGVSNRTCDVVRERYKGLVYTVYNGVNQTIFKMQEKSGEKKAFRILCVANLIPIKGQTYLLRAVAEIVKQGYPAELVIVGEGPDEKALKDECEKIGITDDVRFLGALLYENVAEEMREADMFIMPSYFEAFGCVYVEAMSSGALTCACRHGGGSEIISDGVNGLLVEEKDVDSIVSAILFAINNPRRAREMVERGRERAAEFTWAASAKELEKVYCQCCYGKEDEK